MAKRTRSNEQVEREQLAAELEEVFGPEGEEGEREALQAEVDALDGGDEPTPDRFCECGCNTVVGKKARFTPGHDMRLKSALLTRYDAGDQSAGKELVERGWRTEADLATRSANGKATEEQKAECKRARVRAKLDRAREQVAALERELAALA